MILLRICSIQEIVWFGSKRCKRKSLHVTRKLIQKDFFFFQIYPSDWSVVNKLYYLLYTTNNIIPKSNRNLIKTFCQTRLYSLKVNKKKTKINIVVCCIIADRMSMIFRTCFFLIKNLIEWHSQSSEFCILIISIGLYV